MRKDAKKDLGSGLGCYFIFEPLKGTEYTEVFPGEACLTWFLEFGFWSLKFQIGCGEAFADFYLGCCVVVELIADVAF